MFVNKLFLSTQIRFRRVMKIDSKTDKWKSNRAFKKNKKLIVLIVQGFPNILFMGTLCTIIDSLVYPQNFLIFLAAKLNLL